MEIISNYWVNVQTKIYIELRSSCSVTFMHSWHARREGTAVTVM